MVTPVAITETHLKYRGTLNARTATHDATEIERDALVTALHIVLALALLSLFTPIKAHLGPFRLRPFDVLTGVLFIGVLLRISRLPAPRTWIGLFTMLPYLTWHATSAYLYYFENGLRETLQVLIVILFSASLTSLLPVLNYRRLGMMLLAGMAAITAYNAGYHISHGFWTGWKRLDDLKFTFEFLPPVLGFVILFASRRARYGWWLAWAVFGIVLLMSGERKAVIEYGILSAALFAGRRVALAVPIFAVLALSIYLAGNSLKSGYLGEQFQSIARLGDNPHDNFDMIVRGAGPTSLSNAQRIFAFHVGSQMLRGHWVFGVGTNAYQDRVNEQFSFLPGYLLLGIHGEFWDILVQNGVFGLALYLIVWIVGGSRLSTTLWHLSKDGAIESFKAPVVWILIIIPAVLFVGFEAAGTHAFVTLLLVSLSPEIVRYGLRGHAALATRSRTDSSYPHAMRTSS